MEKKRIDLCTTFTPFPCVLVCGQQMETLQSQITSSTTEVKTFTTELSELKRTYQSLEISLQSILKEVL